MGNRLLEKYQDVIKSINESTGIKIVSVEEVEDNQAFLAVEKLISRGSGFSRNSTGSTPTAGLEDIRGLMSFFQIIDI